MTDDVSRPPSPTPLCPACGYDLRGLASGRCPECGLAIDDSVDTALTLPWAHRRSIGRARAYIRTAALATFGPKRLAANVARPVSWADAVAFRRVTVAVAVLPIALVATAILLLPEAEWLHPALRHPLLWWAELLAVPVAWAGLWLAGLTAAGVGSYWFHPRSIPVVQQNRAVALSLYACGPLAFLPAATAFTAALAVVAAAVDTDRKPWDTIAITLGCGAVAVVIFVGVAWWWSTVALLRHTTHRGFARQLCLGACLPICWAVLAAVFAVALPAAYLWLAVVFKSVHGAG